MSKETETPPAVEGTPPATPPVEGTPPATPAVDEAKLGQLIEGKLREFFGALQGTPPTPGSPPPVAAASAATPPDERSIADMVRGILASEDRDKKVSALEGEVAALKDKLGPPKRGWGSWFVGAGR